MNTRLNFCACYLKKILTFLHNIHTSYAHTSSQGECRLRAVECPSDLIDQIGGWTRGSVGEGYGKGYDLDIKWRWIEKLINKL